MKTQTAIPRVSAKLKRSLINEPFKGQLTQALIKELFDYKDGCLFWKISLSTCIIIGKEAGSYSCQSNRNSIKISGKVYSRARLVFLWHNGYLPKIVDHKDRDRRNDRIENLRAANHVENARNSDKRKKNTTSKYLGVSFNKQCKKFAAHIKFGPKATWLGTFDSEIEAAKAYDIEAIKHFGEFANPNFK